MGTLIITDSRGLGLQRLIEEMGEYRRLRVMVHSGAGYELATLKSIQTIKDMKPDLVIIMVGICDLTWRNRINKITSLRYSNVRDAVAHVIDAARAAHSLLQEMGNHKISFATVTGIDLTDYNDTSRKYMTAEEYKIHCASTKITHREQNTLNDAVLEINKQLTKLNAANSVPTVWTAGVVHTYARRKHHHYYIRLRDGCHPDEPTKKEWAIQINKAIIRINRPDPKIATQTQ